jgi:sigma-E factor negative regulatory protein RseC
MATEKGIVIRLEDSAAWVKTSRSSACEGCSARKGCHITADGQDMEVRAANDIGARVGDRVLVGIASASVLKISFLLYMFPVLLMIAGAAIGQQVAAALGMQGSVPAALGGVACFAVAFGVIRIRSRRLAARKEYQPRIVRVISRQVPTS